MDETIPQRLLALAKRNDALLTGEFQLKSGRTTNYFLDLGRLSTGKALYDLGMLFAEKMASSGAEPGVVIYGPPYKGIPIAIATAIALERDFGIEAHYSFNRKTPKEYAERRAFLGTELADARQIFIVDDVLTDGGTKYEAVELIRGNTSAEILGLVIAMDRQEEKEQGANFSKEFSEKTGVPVLALSTRSDLESYGGN